MKDIYHDIDMKNAHPTILAHICANKMGFLLHSNTTTLKIAKQIMKEAETDKISVLIKGDTTKTSSVY